LLGADAPHYLTVFQQSMGLFLIVHPDTVVLLGSVSSQFQGANRLYFWTGAVSASTLWFIGLSFGGRMLAPLFRKPVSWRILDSLVCATMWTIAGSLIMHGADL
jgi:L-lysine exporter family protein LysE/ArgO